MLLQQGDVLLKKVSKVQGKKLNHLILAEGEATGHCHVITKGDAELYDDNGTLYLKVFSDEAELTHQEHDVITIKKGEYEIDKVREYDHFAEEARLVRD